MGATTMSKFFLVLAGGGGVLLLGIVVLAIFAMTGHFEPSHAGPAS
jgi:hypothetical protein